MSERDNLSSSTSPTAAASSAPQVDPVTPADDVTDPARLAPPANLVDSPLVNAAIGALQSAGAIVPDEQTLLVEERNIWQPTSWLIQSVWETLADLAADGNALTVAGWLAERQAVARLQALYRLARQLPRRPALGPLLQHELQQWHYRLFHTHPAEAKIENLLLVATSAALVADVTLAAACLERIDNMPKGWERIVIRPELRDQLALCIVHVGPHPLTNDLIHIAIRRFDDAGAQLLYTITTRLSEQLAMEQPGGSTTATPSLAQTPALAQDVSSSAAKAARLMRSCLDTLRLTTLVSLQSRRVAAMIFGQAGEVDEVLTQVRVIESVQTAQRETGFSTEKEDGTILRQVKRVSANSDVDFLVYTLRNAIDAMPLRQLSREERITLADQLALLGIRSDGWTAAGAAATLVELGALRYAIEVIDHVSPRDPSRSEGMLMLVRKLMAMGESQLAAEQAKRALDWAESLEMRNPERALTWGLAEIYLNHQRPAAALALLERWREPTGWRQRLRKWRGEQLDDDGLRNSRLRLQALLQLRQTEASPPLAPDTVADDKRASHTAADTTAPPAAIPVVRGENTNAANPLREINPLLRTVRRAAPRLLEGEALIHFYVDGLLRPLLEARLTQQAWDLLPDLRQALLSTSGNKHADRARGGAIVDGRTATT
ncbi:MAG: hypothetical protein R2867_01795 [Caldilineaceae bacterium]